MPIMTFCCGVNLVIIIIIVLGGIPILGLLCDITIIVWQHGCGHYSTVYLIVGDGDCLEQPCMLLYSMCAVFDVPLVADHHTPPPPHCHALPDGLPLYCIVLVHVIVY